MSIDYRTSLTLLRAFNLLQSILSGTAPNRSATQAQPNERRRDHQNMSFNKTIIHRKITVLVYTTFKLGSHTICLRQATTNRIWMTSYVYCIVLCVCNDEWIKFIYIISYSHTRFVASLYARREIVFNGFRGAFPPKRSLPRPVK